jgi:hypothetical protein
LPIKFLSVERVRFDEDRLKEAQFWASKSIAERVIAGWELADENFRLRDADEPKRTAAITLRRVPRSGSF